MRCIRKICLSLDLGKNIRLIYSSRVNVSSFVNKNFLVFNRVYCIYNVLFFFRKENVFIYYLWNYK